MRWEDTVVQPILRFRQDIIVKEKVVIENIFKRTAGTDYFFVYIRKVDPV